MQVIAIERGWDSHGLREIGDQFEMPDGAKATWFKPVPSEVKRDHHGKKKHVENDDEKPADDAVLA